MMENFIGIFTSMVRILSLMLTVLLSACMMVGPNYKEPKKPVAAHWAKTNPSVQEKPFNHQLWWQAFHDSTLNDLIAQGYHNNLDLQTAGVKVLQTRAQLAQTVGQLYPQQQSAVGNFTYTRLGGTSLNSILPSTFDTASLGFSANWEVDFWGKYRRAVQAQDAVFLGSVAAYDNALVSLTADIAATYIKIRTDQALMRITQANIEVQKIGLRIARARYSAGQTSLVDVEQAATELAQTQATLPGIITDLQQQKDALAVLLGTLPNAVDSLVNPVKKIPQAPSSIAVGMPKELLARRPDIQEARLNAVSQSAAIGAIQANLYPALSLNGSFAFTANNIGSSSITDIFQWANRNIIAGPSFNWPLLNYGQITNAVRAQDAIFQQALLQYANVVLKAQKEVQDYITAYIEAKNTVVLLSRANGSATKSLKLALIRYKEGETDFTPVLNAEQQQLSVQTSLVNAQGNIPLSLIGLYRALGGGWGVRGTNDLVSQEIKRDMAARTNWGTLLQPANHEPPSTHKQKLKQLYLPKW